MDGTQLRVDFHKNQLEPTDEPLLLMQRSWRILNQNYNLLISTILNKVQSYCSQISALDTEVAVSREWDVYFTLRACERPRGGERARFQVNTCGQREGIKTLIFLWK